MLYSKVGVGIYYGTTVGSEDNSWELALAFHLVDPEDCLKAVGLGGLDLPSHLNSLKELL